MTPTEERPATPEKVATAPEVRRRLRRITRWTVLGGSVWLFVVGVGGLWMSSRLVHTYVDNVAFNGAYGALATSRVVNRTLTEMESFAQVIANHVSAHALLRTYNAHTPPLGDMPERERRTLLQSDPAVRQLGEFFDLIGRDLSYSRIYLLNQAGINVASNDGLRPSTLLGNTYPSGPISPAP